VSTRTMEYELGEDLPSFTCQLSRKVRGRPSRRGSRLRQGVRRGRDLLSMVTRQPTEPQLSVAAAVGCRGGREWGRAGGDLSETATTGQKPRYEGRCEGGVRDHGRTCGRRGARRKEREATRCTLHAVDGRGGGGGCQREERALRQQLASHRRRRSS